MSSDVTELLLKKQECEKAALEIVKRLIQPNVEQEFLIQNSLKLCSRHYIDVVEERRLSCLCGWPLCDKKVVVVAKKQQFQIRGKRVLDITQRKSFCSAECYGQSTHFATQILSTPLWLRREEGMQLPQIRPPRPLHGVNVDIGLNTTKQDCSSSSDTE